MLYNSHFCLVPNISITPKGSREPVQELGFLPHLPRHHAMPICSLSLETCLFWVFGMNGSIQCETCSVWLLSVCFQSSSTCNTCQYSLLFVAE